jgi:hypothetical protein
VLFNFPINCTERIKTGHIKGMEPYFEAVSEHVRGYEGHIAHWGNRRSPRIKKPAIRDHLTLLRKMRLMT